MSNRPAMSAMAAAVMTKHRLTEDGLALLLGCNQSTVHRIRAGITQPGYRIGRELERLYDGSSRVPRTVKRRKGVVA